MYVHITMAHYKTVLVTFSFIFEIFIITPTLSYGQMRVFTMRNKHSTKIKHNHCFYCAVVKMFSSHSVHVNTAACTHHESDLCIGRLVSEQVLLGRYHFVENVLVWLHDLGNALRCHLRQYSQQMHHLTTMHVKCSPFGHITIQYNIMQ